MTQRGWWGNSAVMLTGRGRIADLPFSFTPSRRIWQRLVATTLTVALISLFVAMGASNPGRATWVTGDGRVVNPPTLAALGASCLGIVTMPASPEQANGWIPQPDVTAKIPPSDQPSWLSIPPVNGNFYPEPFLKTATPVPHSGGTAEEVPRLGEAVSLLYRGWVVIWYRASVVPEDDVRAFTTQVENTPELSGTVLISPWPYEETLAWEGDQSWVYTAWGSWQKCYQPSVKVAEQFRAANPTTAAPGWNVPLFETGPAATMLNKDVTLQQ